MRKPYLALTELFEQHERDLDNLSNEDLDFVLFLMNTAFDIGCNKAYEDIKRIRGNKV